MQRVFAVVLVLVVFAIGGAVWAAPIPAAPIPTKDDAATTKRQISDAYLNVLNEFVPMRERLAAIEGGDRLRATLREFDKLDKVAGLEFRAVKLSVNSVRAHAGNAEVNLGIYLDFTMVTGWSGVARKIDGEWVVARATVCTMLAEWTPVRCPNGPKRNTYTYRKPAKVRSVGGDRVIPITFTDGDRADLFVPKDLAKGWQIVPHAVVEFDGKQEINVYFQPRRAEASQPVRSYPGAAGRPDIELDAMNGLLVQLGKWTAFAYAEQLSERQRRLIAKHLDGYTTASGFPVLIPTGPLAFVHRDPAPTEGVSLAKSALNIDDTANPMELTVSDHDTYFISVVITPEPCLAVVQPPVVSGNYRAEERCAANGFGRIAVEGSSYRVTRLLDELRVENYRAAPATSTA